MTRHFDFMSTAINSLDNFFNARETALFALPAISFTNMTTLEMFRTFLHTFGFLVLYVNWVTKSGTAVTTVKSNSTLFLASTFRAFKKIFVITCINNCLWMILAVKRECFPYMAFTSHILNDLRPNCLKFVS